MAVKKANVRSFPEGSGVSTRPSTQEEKFLAKGLPGYSEYLDKVRCRLLPPIW